MQTETHSLNRTNGSGRQELPAVIGDLVWTGVAAKVRRMLDRTSAGLALVDREGRHFCTNPAYAAIMGHDPTELQRMTLGECVDPNYAAGLRGELQAVARGERLDAQIEVPLASRDGGTRWASVRIAAAADEWGNEALLVVTLGDVTAARQAEAELEELRRQSERLQRVAPIPIFCVDSQSVVTSINTTAAEVLGYTPEEMIGQRCTFFAADPCRERCALFFSDEPKPILARECTVQTKDGQIRTIIKNCDLLRDKAGQVIGGIESFEDVTERKRIEQELHAHLRESLALGRIIARTSSADDIDAVLRVACDELAHFFHVPQTAFALLNAEGTEATVIAEYREGHATALGVKIPVAGNPSMTHLRERRKPLAVADAQHDPMLTPVHHVMRERGIAAILLVPIVVGQRMVGTLGIDSPTPREFTKADVELVERVAAHVGQVLRRKKAERELQAQRDFVLHILNTMGQGLTVADTHGLLQYANPAFARMLGYTPRALIGTTSFDLTVAEEHAVLAESYRKRRAGESDTYKIRLRRCDGSAVPVLVNAVPRWVAGRVVGSIAVVTDQTERMEAERALADARDKALEAAALKSEFLASMSHEIRTPLNAIVGLTELLLDIPQDQAQQHHLETIRKSGDTLLTLVNDVLDFSKVEAGRMVLEQMPFDLGECVEGAVDLLRTKAAEKGLVLTHQVDAPLPTIVVGDVTRLRQVLVNLVGNAVKFTARGRVEVRVSGQPTEDSGITPSTFRFHFAVQDTGIGIPEDRMDRLFRSYTQLDSSTTREYGGTGLGLSISKRLVEMMGGTIWVESERDQGSTFHFTMVAEVVSENRGSLSQIPGPRPPDVESPAPPERDIGTACCPPVRILLAEDNLINQQVMRHMLERLGYQADVCSNGMDVLSVLKRQPYDVILMDVEMPQLDGAETTRRIHQEWDPTVWPWIIALTGHALKGDRDRFLKAGMNDYLSKPVRMQALADALARSPRREKLLAHDQPPAADQGGPLNIDALEELRFSLGTPDSQLLAELTTAFGQQAEKLLAAMDSAARAGDAEQLHRAAHTLKGSSAMLGAVQLSALCAKLDQIASSGDLDMAEETIAGAEAMYQKTQKAFAAYLAGIADRES